MPSAAADRNLLFGILAVQMDFVSAPQLIAGMNAWVLDKSRPLGEHLIAAGSLQSDAHDLIDALVDKHVAMHGGQVEQSLAAVAAVETLRKDLTQIADVDVQQSLARAVTPNNDRHATIAMPARRPPAPGNRFQILRPHASGGLGKVSIARDGELNREVALKELHDRHADNPDNRARFLQEAEITGGLEHPGVVPIYALGQYSDGRPYYAMRFIRGDSLAQAIERFHREADAKWSRAADVLQLRRLLLRLLDVCNAMDYAHSRGVLHRDLKPSNIMLGQYGETLVVDWGLAKAIGAKDATPLAHDATVPISHEGMLTPQSGSASAPTQMGSAIGTPAFMSPEQAAGKLDQLGPTSDVYSLGATLYVLLTGQSPQGDDDLGIVLQRVQRGEFPRPRAIKPVVPRALEAICLKAMALAPRDRYASARLLGDDIEAWLADEPVTARPDSMLTRSFRWVKTHRTLVTSGAAMVLVALIALGAGNVRLQAANDRERNAKNDAVAAQKKAEAAKLESERQTARNEELVQLARSALARYETISQSEALRRYGMEPLRRELLEASIEFYATLGRQVGESEEARTDRGEALYRLGWTYSQLGNVEKGLAAFDETEAIFKQLVKEFPDNRRYQRGVASALVSIGELKNNTFDATAAEASLREARSTIERLLAKDPNDADAKSRLAYANSLEGERLRQLGQLEAAATVFLEGVEVLRGIDLNSLKADENTNVRYRLGRALMQLGALESQALWKFDEGREHFDQAKAVLSELYKEHPDIGDAGQSLAQVLRNSGDLHARQHYYEPAQQDYAAALAVITELDRQYPNTPHYRMEMAELQNSLGSLHRPFESGNMSPEAVGQLEQAVAIGQEMSDQSPLDVSRRLSLARYQSSLAYAYLLRDRSDDSNRLFDAAQATLKVANEQTGDNIDALYTLGELQYAIGRQLGDMKRVADALTMLDASEETLERLIALSPRFGEAHLSLWNVYIERASLFGEDGRLVDALVELRRLEDMGEKLEHLNAAQWMRSAAQAVGTLSKTMRLGWLVQIRNGELASLARAERYEVARNQALGLAKFTGRASDHYIAAQTLGFAALTAKIDEKIPEAERLALADSLGSAAVAELDSAWRRGFLRRRTSSLTGWLRSNPDIATMLKDDAFQVLKGRTDFADLVQRIETTTPPTSSATDPPEGEGEKTAKGE